MRAAFVARASAQRLGGELWWSGTGCGSELSAIGGFSASESPTPGPPGTPKPARFRSRLIRSRRCRSENRDLRPLERKINIIEVRVDGGGCDNARATAEELVRLYNQLPG
jgi:hypothetical protein